MIRIQTYYISVKNKHMKNITELFVIFASASLVAILSLSIWAAGAIVTWLLVSNIPIVASLILSYLGGIGLLHAVAWFIPEK